jgi:hypothetical protein
MADHYDFDESDMVSELSIEDVAALDAIEARRSQEESLEHLTQLLEAVSIAPDISSALEDVWKSPSQILSIHALLIVSSGIVDRKGAVKVLTAVKDVPDVKVRLTIVSSAGPSVDNVLMCYVPSYFNQ